MTIRDNKLALVERLADDLAHEIKNPLHSMVINLEVLRRRLARMGSGPNEDLLRYTGVLGAELERVNRRIDLLLRMVRPQRDEESALTVPEIFEELRELIELEASRHEVSIDMEASAELIRTRLPRSATLQLILSLALETLDSLPEGATLRIHARAVEDGVRISFHGQWEDQDAPPEARPRAEGAYLEAARALVAGMGGRIDTIPDTPDALPGARAFLLIVPAA